MTGPLRCPTCDSREPRLHPAVSGGGEVTHLCPDAFHAAAARPVDERRELGQALVRVTEERDSAYKQRDELEIEANTLNQLLFGVENERDRYRAERDEARDEVVRLGRTGEDLAFQVRELKAHVASLEAQVLADAKEFERLRTIIGELGAAEAAEPPEGIEALRPEDER